MALVEKLEELFQQYGVSYSDGKVALVVLRKYDIPPKGAVLEPRAVPIPNAKVQLPNATLRECSHPAKDNHPGKGKATRACTKCGAVKAMTAFTKGMDVCRSCQKGVSHLFKKGVVKRLVVNVSDTQAAAAVANDPKFKAWALDKLEEHNRDVIVLMFEKCSVATWTKEELLNADAN